ncbi:hypothetical protein [Yersinia rohdei]|uniref:hypothetical protein n=1 Tax=Yersinia rohdei TaxID=29485 RepID=UPI0021BD3C2D|nr:hypothetical protein [Yersinia rohdei]
MFFTGEQRAIGERMLTLTKYGFNCIGYGEFIKANSFINEPFFIELRNEVFGITKNINSYRARLLKLQHALIDLINFLDPNEVRFNGKKFKKI